MKATEGTTYRDPNFTANYTDAYNAGLIRGAYHFATPTTSTGAAQADDSPLTVARGQRTTRRCPPCSTSSTARRPPLGTEPGVDADLDHRLPQRGARQDHPLGDDLHDDRLVDHLHRQHAAYSANDPLFIARYASSVGTLPAGWPFYTFWQYADSGTFPGDQDYFNGPLSGLKNLANDT